MNAAAIQVAKRWLADRQLADDLVGRDVRLVTFASNEDCAFFYPRRTSLFHLKVNKELAPVIRKSKGKVARGQLAPSDYWHWLDERKITEDTPARRLEFAESRQGSE